MVEKRLTSRSCLSTSLLWSLSRWSDLRQHALEADSRTPSRYIPPGNEGRSFAPRERQGSPREESGGTCGVCLALDSVYLVTPLSSPLCLLIGRSWTDTHGGEGHKEMMTIVKGGGSHPMRSSSDRRQSHRVGGQEEKREGGGFESQIYLWTLGSPGGRGEGGGQGRGRIRHDTHVTLSGKIA